MGQEIETGHNQSCFDLFFRLKGDDFDPNKAPDPEGIRIVISAPDKNIPLMKSDIAFMLVQYEGERDP